MEQTVEETMAPVVESQDQGNDTQRRTFPTADLLGCHSRMVQGLGTTDALTIPAPVYVYIDENPSQLINDAIPIERASVSTPAACVEGNDRELASAGTRMGRLSAELEREGILRAGQDIRAIHHYANAAVEEGNRIASHRTECINVPPQAGKVTGPVQSAPLKEEPELYGDTCGKEYEVSTYNVCEYNTEEYEISGYKSLYES